MSGIAIVSRCTDAVISRYGASEHNAELSLAKDEYGARRGRVFEDDEQWESFTRGFLEWYVVERPWRDTGKPPTQLELASESEVERIAALKALTTSQRCLVEIQQLKNAHIDVVDLIGGAAFSVHEERSLAGLSKGDVVEVRLIGYGAEVSLGRTFLFHPPGTIGAIRKQIATMHGESASRTDIIDRLALLRSKSQSYRHVSPIRIYESNGAF